MAPVEQGEERDIRIREYGNEGDGIGYVHGFVIVVPDAGIGQWVTVTINAVHENFALASVKEENPNAIFEQQAED